MPDPEKPNKAESQMTLASARSSSMERPKGWWGRRTLLEKSLTMLSTIAIFVIVALALSMAAVLTGHSGFGSPKTGRHHLTRRSVDYEDSATRLETAESQTRDFITVQKLVQNTRSPDKNLETLPEFDDCSGSDSKREELNYCNSTGCVQTAATLLENIDRSVDPCENFFEYSCGLYVKNKIIPDEKSSISQFSEISDELQAKLRTLVDEDYSSKDPASSTLVKHLYKSCMDKSAIAAQGMEPLKEVIRTLGGWPAVEGDAWDVNKFNWTNTIYLNRKLGYSVDLLFDFSITTNIKNSSWRIIDIDQPPLGMPSRKYLLKGLNDSVVQAYLEYQVSLAELLGANRTRAKEELTESLQFEMKIANSSLPKEQRRNASALYNKMTIYELTQLVPNIPWLTYINKILQPFDSVTQREQVVVNVPKYLVDLGRLLDTTPPRVLANYMLWRVAASSVSYLTEEARDIQLEYSKKITGTEYRQPRWKECMRMVSGSLSHAVGKLYAEKFFRNDAKEQADTMVSYIRAEFDKILRTVDWMDSSTRLKAINKSLSIVPHIAYPSELLMESKLNELYQDLEISSGQLLWNMRNLTIFGTDYSFRRLREKVNKNDWKNWGAAAVVNAFYSPLDNSIQFPAGILQGSFFNADRPNYMNYGAIGFVIGHEITHGFDDMGRQYNSRGDLMDWWAPETAAKFLEKSKCIVDQYNGFRVDQLDINLNGINTQGENIADNGGLKQAYNAYSQWVDDNGDEKPLPGFENFTSKQSFWLAAANVWCSKSRLESLKLQILTGVHSPAQFRVNGPMMNLPEFSRDWGCKSGSYMNPTHKCTVW